MQFRIFLAVSITLLISLAVTAQTIRKPFSDIDKEEKVLTLTNGKYEEFFDDDSLQRIGTALININTMKVVKLQLTEDEQRIMDNSASSRFLSIDPLASSFVWNSPYAYAENDVIRAIDLDGLEKYVVTNYLDRAGFISSTTITTLTDNQINQNVNMQLKLGNKLVTTRDVLIRNVRTSGRTTYRERNNLSASETRILSTGTMNRPSPQNPTSGVIIGGQVAGDNSPTLVSTKTDFPTSQFILIEMSANSVAVSPSYQKNLTGSIFIGTTPMLGQAGNQVKNGTLFTDPTLTNLTQEINNINTAIKQDGNVSAITISISGIIGNGITSTADPAFSEFTNGLQYAGEQLKQKLTASGVNPNNIRIAISTDLSNGRPPRISANIQTTRTPQPNN